MQSHMNVKLQVEMCRIYIHFVIYLMVGMRQKTSQLCNNTNQAFFREAQRNLDIKEKL